MGNVTSIPCKDFCVPVIVGRWCLTTNTMRSNCCCIITIISRKFNSDDDNPVREAFVVVVVVVVVVVLLVVVVVVVVQLFDLVMIQFRHVGVLYLIQLILSKYLFCWSLLASASSPRLPASISIAAASLVIKVIL